MSTNYTAITNTNFTDSKLSHFVYETVNECPVCKSKISPVLLFSVAHDIDTVPHVSLFNYCSGCHSTFVSLYKAYSPTTSSTHVEAVEYLGSEPNRYSKHIFDEKIIALSPQFDKIYNQALAAETTNLDEIAGLGYRKAMEFLVKDFAIHLNPNDIDDIKKQPLAQCIKNYISSPDIKTLAERCAWIGNDEAHYVRVQEDRDVSDMKSFIQAMVYFIGMILITEDASSMSPKK